MKHLTIVNESLTYPEVTLKSPSKSRFILLAAEIDYSISPFHLHESRRKKVVIEHAKEVCRDLGILDGVSSAVTFKAMLTAPGRGKFLKERKNKVHIAKFDVVVLIEVADSKVADTIVNQEGFRSLLKHFDGTASYFYMTQATNIKRIDSVDHGRQGVFLFNYFFADNIEQNIGIWHYTAGYFQKETGLDNSTVLLPLARGDANYSIINHCRWNHLSDILPTLLFKKTFHSYVLENFQANSTAAMPILYKLA